MASAQKAITANTTDKSIICGVDLTGNIQKLTARTNESEYKTTTTNKNTALTTYLDSKINVDVDGGL